MTDWPVHARFDGPIVLVGFGSIGRGVLPLLERHIAHDKAKFTIIAPEGDIRGIAKERGLRFIALGLTPDNFREILTPLLTQGPGRGMIVNLSVDVSSVAMMDFARDVDAFYIDTVVEPWAGFYADPKATVAERSNYALRESLLALRGRRPGGVTAVNCCGANPGMVSWLVKQALVNVAADLGIEAGEPVSREDWARLMQRVGVKGIHVAERDTQRAKTARPRGIFVNTWSVEGFVGEGLQPAELGWGTHEKALPPEGRQHEAGCGAAIYLMRPGAGTRVRSWTPTPQAQHGFLITHNEAISISDYFTVRDGDKISYRPTCHYAYHPCDDAVLSLDEMAGAQWQPQPEWRILEENEILDGIDELGVLLYGHSKNAYWYGSQLSVEEARTLAPYQNATGLQVTSAVLAGIVWMLENPDRGIVEADEMDYRRCLEVQRPYLGPVIGAYTDWTPLKDRGVLFPEDLDNDDPWQFKNVIVRG
ncbi:MULTISPECIES: saccharopine dehydrogenase C-terminal domain-containing protein [unclassified Chelatococcus]|uniref:homospermidine synthase n=1 Tax=unclassified Chelatococcus TaxID=2638111 RepID=UPI001BCA7C31|nr:MULTISPECIES: saccharopine dehydrogenase C-terminal domain-containing protein [unclassified Chelatococcus]CAH1663688.1 Homospermidine synthase [Hyphomicrobiales bacterium]MBS7741608.1 homospermidine synthase [Chelatococcus sp. HY11]MBX3544373.1 homospermidine synthase [Chelatococcus sp.]MCO5079103.1 saccharopine dehydrogenase NADP-binding domain-containing protein [Chelatococcus sp.]CAH1682133.1 Homospermidine synthase [Hyphomicrobiales bacterium]